LAPLGKYFAALGPDSLALYQKYIARMIICILKNLMAPMLLWYSGIVLAWQSEECESKSSWEHFFPS